MTALVILEAVVIALLVVLVAGLLRSHAEILRRLHELGAGENVAEVPTMVAAPRGSQTLMITELSGVTPAGGAASVALAGSRGLVLVTFLTSGCSSCRPLWRGLGRPITMPRKDIRTVVVTKGPEEESPATIRNLAPSAATVIMSSAAWDAFRVPVAPYFALVDASRGRVIGEGAAGSWPQVAELAGRALGDAAGDARLNAGTAQRIEDTDDELRRAGIEPGDASLWSQPDEGASP